ncbi:hypothetical protein ACJX0J_015191, partial [Zea mays]
MTLYMVLALTRLFLSLEPDLFVNFFLEKNIKMVTLITTTQKIFRSFSFIYLRYSLTTLEKKVNDIIHGHDYHTFVSYTSEPSLGQVKAPASIRLHPAATAAQPKKEKKNNTSTTHGKRIKAVDLDRLAGDIHEGYYLPNKMESFKIQRMLWEESGCIDEGPNSEVRKRK